MRTIEGIERLPGPSTSAVVAVGTFDGVHLGHQALMRRVVEAAAELGGVATALTFDPSPGECFSQNGSAGRLTPRAERLGLLAAAGIELSIIVPFTAELAAWPWRRFARIVYQEGLGARLVIAGPDHTFGAGGEGTPDRLAAFGRDAGFAVDVVPRVCVDGIEVRSTAIRQAVARGDVAGAAVMLGRRYALSGEVVAGRGEGRKLGFPTANVLCPPDKMLPADGVYAAIARLPAAQPAAVHIGGRPTYALPQRAVEAHVTDFDGDLVGCMLRLELVQRLREPETFASPRELAAQIRRDVERTREVARDALAGEPSAAT